VSCHLHDSPVVVQVELSVAFGESDTSPVLRASVQCFVDRGVGARISSSGQFVRAPYLPQGSSVSEPVVGSGDSTLGVKGAACAWFNSLSCIQAELLVR
jgi:hypothetical protein